MIKNIGLCPNHARMYSAKQGFKVNVSFQEGYNAIISPNAKGKSIILQAIANCSSCNVQKTPRTKIKYFTQEKLNPALKRKNLGIKEMTLSSRANFSSHGETVLDVLRNSKYNGENCFLFDYPESGLDFENVEKMRKRFAHLGERDLQTIIATHNPLFLKEANIIELEKGYLKKLIKQYSEVLDILKHR